MSYNVLEANCPSVAVSPGTQFPVCLLADDATAADQLALSVLEAADVKVVTLDTRSVGESKRGLDEGCVRVINTGTRAVSAEEADVRSQSIASQMLRAEDGLPLLQIDSRLRGIRNALRGLYQALSFDCLLFVPAEPELGRLVQQGSYYHVEDGQLKPLHQSVLAASLGRALGTSDLRPFVAAELGIAQEKVFCVGGEIISEGADAIVSFIRGLKQQGKCVVIPDITRAEHFQPVIEAFKGLSQDKVLLAGSRTFLRGFFASFESCKRVESREILVQAIDREKRGAPLAIICSLEPVMNSQVEYAQRALGPNLVAVVFDSGVILADDRALRQEVDRVQQVVLQSLRAMRPVLLRTSGAQLASDPAVLQRLLDAISRVVSDGQVPRHTTSLLIAGGHTAETIRIAVGASAVQMKGAFQKSIPWGLPLEGALKGVPLVTKGGHMGGEDVLYAFFEQGHPLPRANVLPVVTPLTRDKQIDEAGIEGLIGHLVRLGTTDIFAVGNAGEFRYLTNPQRLRALELFARKAKGRLRVFAGVTGDNPEETLSNYEAAGRMGVFAAVIMPLYFLKKSEDIVPFVSKLASTSCRLPLVLYNNAARTGGQDISYEAVEALSFPVVALKDSSGDPERLARYASMFPVYQGQQRQLLEGYRKGARGAIAIIGHVSPLPNEFFAPGTSEARREEIAESINTLSKTVKQGGAEVAAFKYLLSRMGLMGDTVASNEAARELTPAQREQICSHNADLISAGRVPG